MTVTGSPASMSLRRWELADPKSRTPRLPAVKGGLVSPLSARGAKAVKDIQPLAEPSSRSLTERTLEAAEAWSIPGTPFKGLDASHPSRGFELSQESRSGFFGRLTGLDIEAELQRHAVLLKGLLRDMAVIRDTVWHLADERSMVSSAAQDAKEASDQTAELRLSLSDLALEVHKQRERPTVDAKLLQSMQESSMETRYEDQSLREETFEEYSRNLEGRFQAFQEQHGSLSQRLEEHGRNLEGRFEEQHGLLSQKLEEHGRNLEGRFEEQHGLLSQKLEVLMQEHSRALEERYQEHQQIMEERFQEVHEKVGNLRESLHKEVHLRQQALRGNVVRNISASLADEVAERACESVTPVIERIMAEARGERPATSPPILQGDPYPQRGRKHLIQIRPQALRGNVVRNISASLADEVAERACESVTPVIERIMAEARGERPATSPPILQGNDPVGSKQLVMEEEAQLVAAEVAAELIQLLFTDWRNTPSPQEVWP